jgi:hypothetical protein
MPIPMTKCDAVLGAEINFDLSGPIDDATFAELDAHCVKPEFLYRHRWREGRSGDVGQYGRDAPGDLRLCVAAAAADASHDGDWRGAVLICALSRKSNGRGIPRRLN